MELNWKIADSYPSIHMAEYGKFKLQVVRRYDNCTSYTVYIQVPYYEPILAIANKLDGVSDDVVKQAKKMACKDLIAWVKQMFDDAVKLEALLAK